MQGCHLTVTDYEVSTLVAKLLLIYSRVTISQEAKFLRLDCYFSGQQTSAMSRYGVIVIVNRNRLQFFE